MDEADESVSPRMLGPLPFVLLLLRVPLIVGIVLFAVLADIAIPGSMREALRYALIDRPHQLLVIGGALLLACAAIRFTAEATIELVSPELYHHDSHVSHTALLLPRLLALIIAVAVAVPLIELAIGGYGLTTPEQRLTAAGAGASYVLLALFVAVMPAGPHRPSFVTRKPSVLTRLGFALIPVALAVALGGAVLGVWKKDTGTAEHALERYVSAFVGTVSDPTTKDNALETWVHDASGAPNLRYAPYVKAAPRTASTIPPILIVAELASLLAACIVARIATAVLLDVLFPRLGVAHIVPFRWIRRSMPPLVSFGLALAVAVQFLETYLGSSTIHLSSGEAIVVWAIAALYAMIGVVASLGSGSDFVPDGPWRASPSVGRRFLGAARRLASLEPTWQWFIRGILLFGVAIFLMFSDLRNVGFPQWLGPVAIILMWGATATALFFPFAYLSHMVRVPFLAVLFVAAATFSGFNLNDNHELRVVDEPSLRTAEKAHVDRRPALDLAAWIASRADWSSYRRYPVFLVATEGGGIRAAYFTATALAAIQERCPAFAQHTLAISGVSGGSLGAAVFAGLAADQARNVAVPGCNIDRAPASGPLVVRARAVLSADLLSPLLGATLFPDALQRVIPVSVGAFDRARALEYAIEESWAKATPAKCGDCDADRMAAKAMDMYGVAPPHNAVPNLFLNTTEAGTGQIIPYSTARILALATPFRERAEIDDNDDLDSALPSPSQIESLSLQDRMSDDRIPLSTAAMVSARFPYLTPAGSVGYSGGQYVDGGYFENSGTWLLSGLVQNLIGQQLSYRAGQSPQIDAARNAVFIVIVVQSEPCTRESIDNGCDENATVADDSWSELLSPLRALLSTRDKRAEYSFDGLGALSALIEQLSSQGTDTDDIGDRGVGCDYAVCAVTLRFRNRTRSEIPLSWVLSSAARRSMDNAIDGMEQASVRERIPPIATSNADDALDADRVLGSYRRVLCLLAARNEATGCATAPNLAARH